MSSETIENKTFDEIQVGDTASIVRTLKPEDIQLFAVMSGDINPAHVDPEYARSTMFHEVIAHGMWGGALISTVLGTLYPGPGTIYINQTLKFMRPVTLGDIITVSVTVTGKFEHNHHVTLECKCVNQDGRTVIAGAAEVIAPAEKVRRPKVDLPEVHISDRKARYAHLLERAAGLAPVPMAFVHPCDAAVLRAALAAGAAGLVVPILVGPVAKIRAAAEEAGADLTGLAIVDTPHSAASAERAVAMARQGHVRALMKGSLPGRELMDAMNLPQVALRTARTLSHVSVLDVPTYPRLLLITDALINVEPRLEAKRGIVQNAIDFAHLLGIVDPKVAVLASVETVMPGLRATLDAAALCKMAERGQITGGVLDGPLAFDNAVSMVAAKAKGILSAVAGRADILVVPDVESGTMLVKQLEYLGDAISAGVVLGAAVPIVLPSRADSLESRVASCALAALLAHSPHLHPMLPPLPGPDVTSPMSSPTSA
ncbi:MAG: bifunctional enoyl-CoA hydratase/phosphate acetyltransferase [Betaproteobacteria bacterium]|nr:bifunctional enoyl-CoA hydratase/phosphate acetyltransferase [Betaproteobacteria bacterium]